jgi:hypothetical protein
MFEGIGGLILNPLTQFLLDTYGYPWTYRILGFVSGGVGLIGGAMLRTRGPAPPKKPGLKNLVDFSRFKDFTFTRLYALAICSGMGFFVSSSRVSPVLRINADVPICRFRSFLSCHMRGQLASILRNLLLSLDSRTRLVPSAVSQWDSSRIGWGLSIAGWPCFLRERCRSLLSGLRRAATVWSCSLGCCGVSRLERTFHFTEPIPVSLY